MTSIIQYQEELIGKYCIYCGCDLSTRGVRSYNHSGGYEVEGYEEKQWLSVICGCQYEWSFVKLGLKEIL